MQQLTFDFSPNKPVGMVWPQVCAFENLLLAYYKARKGKRHRDAVARFELNREAALLSLQTALLNGQYQPGAYRQFRIYDKKARIISAAPFSDRVVHHAIMNVVQPLLEPMLYEHCYACRQGFGVHKAVDQYQFWARRYAYVLKMDVQRYFPSIDQKVLLSQLSRVVDDDRLLEVLGKIVESYPSEQLGKGMAIGNLTSQFFANWYLRDIDKLIVAAGFKAYLRYVDDLFVFADSKEALWRLKAQMDVALQALGLCLHQHKAVVCRTTEKVPVLGYQISRDKRWLQSANGKKAFRKIRAQAKACQQKKMRFTDVQPSIRAWIGHAQHGQTWLLREKLFASLKF